MTASGIKPKVVPAPSGFSAKPVPRLLLNKEETAHSLGISVRTLDELVAQNPQLYGPNGSRVIKENPKKDMPLWSADLIEFLAYVRSRTPQGVPPFTESEALKIRNQMSEEKRRFYLKFIEDDSE